MQIPTEKKLNEGTFIQVKEDKKGRLLFEAIEKNDLDRLEDLIFHGADTDVTNKDFQGTDPNVKNSHYNSYNCLQYAAKKNPKSKC